jgi:hypothetical protein
VNVCACARESADRSTAVVNVVERMVRMSMLCFAWRCFLVRSWLTLIVQTKKENKGKSGMLAKNECKGEKGK